MDLQRLQSWTLGILKFVRIFISLNKRNVEDYK